MFWVEIVKLLPNMYDKIPRLSTLRDPSPIPQPLPLSTFQNFIRETETLMTLDMGEKTVSVLAH